MLYTINTGLIAYLYGQTTSSPYYKMRYKIYVRSHKNMDKDRI